MSFVFENPRSSAGDTFAGGIASIGDIYAAARDQALYVDNVTAAAGAMEAAIDQRNAEVFRDTGVKLDNPYRAKFDAAMEDAAMKEQRRFSAMQAGTVDQAQDPAAVIRKGVTDWQAQVATAAGRIPDANVGARLNRSIEADAIKIAQESDDKLSRLTASRGGVGSFGASVAGGFAGTLRDPLQLSLLTLGGGPGAGRTITSRILSTAAKEAFINGASEAVLQPVVQAWRKQAGLDNGFDVALGNIATAAAFGGLVGGGIHAGGELGAKLFGRALDTAGDVAAVDPRVAEPLRRTMQGDIAAGRQTLPEIRDALPAEARGALDHAEVIDHLDATRPRSAAAETHDINVTAAHRAIDSREPPAFKVDQAQVSRIVNDIAGDVPADAATPKARSLAGFLIDHGGIQDHQGELAAIGANTVSEKFRGRLVKKDGMTVDHARELAEEAGYIGRPGETQTTSVADLLSALDEDLRGNQVFAREDQVHAGRAADAEAERAGLERTVAEIAAGAGPGVDDAIIHQAARLSIDEGMHPLDALEHVLTRTDHASLYHGTPFEFREFDLNQSGTASGSKTERAVFFSPDPDEASNFGLSARGDPEQIFLRNHDVDISGFEVVDMQGERARHIPIKDALDRAREEGKPGVIFRNMDDRSVLEAGNNGPIRDQIAVLDLSRISPTKSVQRLTRDRFFGDEPLPGWSDAELNAASAGRGPEPFAEQGTPFDDPGTVDPELEISAAEIKQFAELGVPTDDGRIVPLADFMEDIKAGEDLASIVKACRA